MVDVYSKFLSLDCIDFFFCNNNVVDIEFLFSCFGFTCERKTEIMCWVYYRGRKN